MRAKAHGIRFTLAFVVDESFDQFLGKDIAFQQESMVVFQTP
jgi:hypothetical protein